MEHQPLIEFELGRRLYILEHVEERKNVQSNLFFSKKRPERKVLNELYCDFSLVYTEGPSHEFTRLHIFSSNRSSKRRCSVCVFILLAEIL